MDINIKESMAIIDTFAKELQRQEPDIGVILSLSAINSALEAMKKQIEMEVSDWDGMFVVCPSCKNTVLPAAFCSKCGQALKEK